MVRTDVARRTNALEHDLSAIPVNYDELRWLSPYAVELKSEFVTIKLCRLKDVIDNKVWRNAKQFLLSGHRNLQLHGFFRLRRAISFERNVNEATTPRRVRDQFG